MQKMLRFAVKEINSHLGAPDRRQFDRWLKTEFHATP
jgi:hypothetical protein